MNKVKYSFTTKLTFDNNVHDHFFALRCVPNDNPGQRTAAFDFSISPFVSTCTTTDAFYNKVISGIIHKEHRFLDFEISGEALLDGEAKRTDFMPCYKYQSHYTKPEDKLKAFYASISAKCGLTDNFERAKF